MAATTSQGKSFTLFITGITVAAAGLAYGATGLGKLALVVGFVIVAFSFARFLKIKPLEGVTAAGKQPAALKLGGLGVVLLGWMIVLFGLHLTASVAGRMITTLSRIGDIPGWRPGDLAFRGKQVRHLEIVTVELHPPTPIKFHPGAELMRIARFTFCICAIAVVFWQAHESWLAQTPQLRRRQPS